MFTCNTSSGYFKCDWRIICYHIARWRCYLNDGIGFFARRQIFDRYSACRNRESIILNCDRFSSGKNFTIYVRRIYHAVNIHSIPILILSTLFIIALFKMFLFPEQRKRRIRDHDVCLI